MSAVSGLFVPGWGATARLYRRGAPDGWTVLELPTFRRTRGRLDVYRGWLDEAIARHGKPVVLAGHSMGGALAVLAASDRPELVEHLALISPAGVPLDKPIVKSAATFFSQVIRGCYPARELGHMVLNTAVAPRCAYRLARDVHDLDLRPVLRRIGEQAVRSTIIGCPTDELVTPAHAQEIAALLGGEYHEYRSSNGHIWPITDPEGLSAELAFACGSEPRSVASTSQG